jgi:hypothetical protein
LSNTTNLALPYIDPNQNQKSVTHNAALTMLDALVNAAVQSATLAAPPGSPADGQRWIVASGGTGAWAGEDGKLAAWQDGAWAFYAPPAGTLAFNVATGGLILSTGSAWVTLQSLFAQLAVTDLGIGTAADTGNPLSATLNNALFNALGTGSGGTGDVRVKLNKATAGNTASFVYQDGFSGRAEIGLCGDDDFHFKVSPDGATFHDGFKLKAATGGVEFNTGIGTTLTPAANGALMFEATSNTTVTVKLKGSDGTLRAATLTLA